MPNWHVDGILHGEGKKVVSTAFVVDSHVILVPNSWMVPGKVCVHQTIPHAYNLPKKPPAKGNKATFFGFTQVDTQTHTRFLGV